MSSSFTYLLLETAVVPLGEVVTMVFLGYILATTYVNVLSENARKLLSKLVFALFLPCLIFSQLGEVLTFSDMLLWWFIPVNVLLSDIIGCVAGYLVARFTGAPPKYRRLVLVLTGIGNVGNIPLAIISSMCLSELNPFGTSDDCSQRGIAYISFAQWVGSMLVYIFVYHMLEPAAEYTESLDDITVPNQFLETEFPHLEEVMKVPGVRTPWITRVFRESFKHLDSEDEDDDSVNNSARFMTSCVGETQQMKQIRIVAEKTPLTHLMQPPTIASMLSIFIGVIPPLKSILFGTDAPLGFFVDSMSIMSNAMIPCIMLVLGGNLSEGPGISRLGKSTIVMSCITRLVFLPLVGMCIVYTAGKLNFLPSEDNLFKFVLLLQHTVPGSILAGGMANLRGYGAKEASSLLFWHHIFSFVTMACFIAIYINWLF